jgi:hypothetical protein
MKIQLTSAEILKAVHQYVDTLGINLGNKTVNIEFIQRQKLGLTADVIITDDDQPALFTAGGTIEIEEAPDAPINDHDDNGDSQSIFG